MEELKRFELRFYAAYKAVQVKWAEDDYYDFENMTFYLKGMQDAYMILFKASEKEFASEMGKLHLLNANNGRHVVCTKDSIIEEMGRLEGICIN